MAASIAPKVPTAGPTRLMMGIAGTELPLLETPVKGKDHTFYCFRLPGGPATMFGVGWEKLAKDLPTSVTIDGEHIPLTKGLTPAADKNGKVKVQRNKVSAQGTFHPKSLGADKGYSVSISETTDGLWNIKVVVNRGAGSVSPEARHEAAVAKAAAAKAAMIAFMKA